MEAIEVVEHHHVKRRRRGAFLFVAVDVEVGVVVAAVGQPVAQRGVAVGDQAVILTTAPRGSRPARRLLGRVFGRFVVGLRLRDDEQRVAIMELGQQLIDVGAIERDRP
jgi:hypothetical protein